MIYESWPWKQEILILKNDIEELLRKPPEEDIDGFRIEKAMFLSAFIIRKLLDAKTKITDATSNRSIKVESFPKIEGVRQDSLNKSDFHNHYDLKQRNETHLSVRKWANYIIHSYLLIPTTTSDEEKWSSIFFTSDSSRKKVLYSVELVEIFSLLERVIDDQVNHVGWSRDEHENIEIVFVK